MNEQNFKYLSDQLKYTGFGEDLQRSLREKMQEQKPDFTLLHKSEFGDQQMEAALQFKKSEQGDMYFFNRYLLNMKNKEGEEAFTQSFRVGRENTITLKEGYNLMNGRAIHKEMTPKEGEKYHAWLQLNFKESDEHGNFKMKQFHQNYGYDLKATLAKYQIKEMANEQSAQSLVRSLERGNKQSVTMMHEGKEQKIFIEASPQFKSLNIYDSEMKRVNIQSQVRSEKETQNLKEVVKEKQTEKQSENQSEKKSKKLDQKEKLTDDGDGGKRTRKQSRKQNQTLS